MRVAIDELGDAGLLGGAQHRRIVGARRAEHDVVADGAVEQHDVLRHVADVAAQLRRVHLSRLDAVDQDAARRRLVQAEHQLLDRRLAGTDAPDQRDALAGRDAEAHAA